MAVSIAEIIILSLMADWLFRRFRIPGLLGMLLVGVILGPHVLNRISPSFMHVGSDLSLIALVVILLRVGFELSRSTLHRVGGRIVLLAFIPATIEGVMITLAGPALLGLTTMESAILGSVLAAVSPAVVVPLMIRFIKERKGEAKDIPSMVMASASIDDIYVIVAHGIILSLYIGLQGSSLPWQVAGIPISLILGVAVGLIIGTCLYKLFDHINPRATKRMLVVVAISLLLVRLQHHLAGQIPFAGLVAAMAIGFVILEKREHMAHEISAKLVKVWVFAEIILFASVGAQVDVGVAWHAGLAGMAIISLGLLARAAGVLLCLSRSPLDMRERFFVATAFSPKATVQAAIGGAPLLAMHAAGMDTGPGEIILAVAVLSIILTAPSGAWAIAAMGDRILAIPPAPEDDAARSPAS